VVADLLAPGGFLYLVEEHPFVQILDDAAGASGAADASGVAGAGGLCVARDYFDAAPQVEDYPYTYTDGPALEHTRQVEFQHSLGEIVTSLAEAGLRIEFLHEYDFDAFGRFDSLQRREDGTYRFAPGQPRVPMQFSLRASASGSG
jgi:hypothetical protein